MDQERRNISARADVVQRVISDVVLNPRATLDVETFHAQLHVPMDAARRILDRLTASGVVREVRAGVWERCPAPTARPY